MHTLFNSVPTIAQGITKFPEWSYVRDGLRRNLGTVISFYRQHPTAVKSSHFLVRLIQSFSVPQSQPLERYYDNIDSVALNMSMALKMTSSIYQGQIFNGVFYGPGNSEIIIGHNTDFDFEAAHRDWENLVPVKVLRHPRSDLALNLPDGVNTGSEVGLVVVSINITLLAVMYRAFRMNEAALNVDGTNSELSVYQFIRMYVIPNMLASHLDIALFNRLDNLYKGAPMGQSSRPHSFFMTDYSAKIERIHADVIVHMKKLIGKNFSGMLRTIPTAAAEDMEMAMLLPDLAPTRQINWALTVSRLNVLLFLIRISKDTVRTRNMVELNQIRRDMLGYRRNNVYRSMLPDDVRYDVETDIQAILEESSDSPSMARL